MSNKFKKFKALLILSIASVLLIVNSVSSSKPEGKYGPEKFSYTDHMDFVCNGPCKADSHPISFGEKVTFNVARPVMRYRNKVNRVVCKSSPVITSSYKMIKDVEYSSTPVDTNECPQGTTLAFNGDGFKMCYVIDETNKACYNSFVFNSPRMTSRASFQAAGKKYKKKEVSTEGEDIITADGSDAPPQISIFAESGDVKVYPLDGESELYIDGEFITHLENIVSFDGDEMDIDLKTKAKPLSLNILSGSPVVPTVQNGPITLSDGTNEITYYPEYNNHTGDSEIFTSAGHLKYDGAQWKLDGLTTYPYSMYIKDKVISLSSGSISVTEPSVEIKKDFCDVEITDSSYVFSTLVENEIDVVSEPSDITVKDIFTEKNLIIIEFKCKTKRCVFDVMGKGIRGQRFEVPNSKSSENKIDDNLSYVALQPLFFRRGGNFRYDYNVKICWKDYRKSTLVCKKSKTFNQESSVASPDKKNLITAMNENSGKLYQDINQLSANKKRWPQWVDPAFAAGTLLQTVGIATDKGTTVNADKAYVTEGGKRVYRRDITINSRKTFVQIRNQEQKNTKNTLNKRKSLRSFFMNPFIQRQTKVRDIFSDAESLFSQNPLSGGHQINSLLNTGKQNSVSTKNEATNMFNGGESSLPFEESTGFMDDANPLSDIDSQVKAGMIVGIVIGGVCLLLCCSCCLVTTVSGGVMTYLDPAFPATVAKTVCSCGRSASDARVNLFDGIKDQIMIKKRSSSPVETSEEDLKQSSAPQMQIRKSLDNTTESYKHNEPVTDDKKKDYGVYPIASA